jgi:hypothetical protein
MDFLKQQFDKLLMTGLVLMFTGVVLYVFIHIPNDKAIDWAVGSFGLMLGALLGLITGYALGKSKPEPPKETQ